MKSYGQLGRFGAVGLVLNAALYVLYLLLTGLGASPIAAATVAFVIGVPLSLTAHRRITFQVSDISRARKAGFALLYVSAYITQIGVLSLLHYGIGLPHPLAQAAAICMTALVTFIVQKRAIFRA